MSTKGLEMLVKISKRVKHSLVTSSLEQLPYLSKRLLARGGLEIAKNTLQLWHFWKSLLIYPSLSPRLIHESFEYLVI